MCSYLHRAPNGVYYFRMGIPADLRPFMAGKREIKQSLGLKDREAAKALIPDMTKTAHSLLKQAERDKAAAKPAAVIAPKPASQIDRERTDAALFRMLSGRSEQRRSLLSEIYSGI